MSKFKVGDEVEVVRLKMQDEEYNISVGDIYKVIDTNAGCVYVITNDKIWHLGNNQLKLAEPIKDNINPSHYKRYRLEMIENIQNSMTHDEFKGYLKGNIMKYISRYQDKNGVEDLKKAEWYLNKLIEVEVNE